MKRSSAKLIPVRNELHELKRITQPAPIFYRGTGRGAVVRMGQILDLLYFE